MERIGEDIVIRLMLSNPTIARLTESVIAAALEGFELTPVRPMSWIARAIQGALYPTLKNADEEPDRQSNASTRDELASLASRASELWRDIFERSSAADDALWRAAWRRAVRDESLPEGVPIGEMPDYQAFSDNLVSLDRMARFLRAVANDLEPQDGPWRNAERREQRVDRAHHLSPIFELAYGRKARVNDFPLAKSLGPWPDFYQRVVAAAFCERATPNLREVVKEASRRHRTNKVEFAPGIIPE